MKIKLKDRWNAMFGGLEFIEVWINENEFIAVESWTDCNGYRFIRGGHDVINKDTNKFVRTVTEDEAKVICDFIIKQFEAEEMMNHDS